MGVLKRIFSIPLREVDVGSYNKMDGILALVFFSFYMTFLYLYGWLMFQTNVMKDMSKIFPNSYVLFFSVRLLMSVIPILPIFFILSFRKQTLASIGFRFKKVLLSIGFGIMGAIILNGSDILKYMNDFSSYPHHGNDLMFELFDTFICVAFVEEIAFRGYIQTRMLGLIRNKYVAILVVGFMFALIHIPFQYQRIQFDLQLDISLMDYIIAAYPSLLFYVVMHVVFVYLYTRNYELIAPTVTHALRNLLNQ